MKDGTFSLLKNRVGFTLPFERQQLLEKILFDFNLKLVATNQQYIRDWHMKLIKSSCFFLVYRVAIFWMFHISLAH